MWAIETQGLMNRALLALSSLMVIYGATIIGQSAGETADAHIAIAKALDAQGSTPLFTLYLTIAAECAKAGRLK